jgi:hypothetical protein
VNTVVRAFTALIAVIVAVFTPGVAMADEPSWHRAVCFSGAIDSIEVAEQGQAFLTLAGHLDCGTRNKQATFGYARYDSSSELGYLTRTDLRNYRNTSPSPFVEGRYVDNGPVSFAICVVTDYDLPVACVRVERPDWVSKLEVAPFGPDEKGAPYSRGVDVVEEHPYRPACGGCW